MAKLPIIPILAGLGAYAYFASRREPTKCRDGFIWDPEIGACVQIPQEPVPPVKCPDGFEYDPVTNSCVPFDGSEPVPPQCEEGFELDPVTNTCVQIPQDPEPSCVINDLQKVLSGSRVLQKGCEGRAVKELQTALVHFFETDLCQTYGIRKFDDGQYGDITASVVKVFQTDADLTPDGIAGKNTVASLKDYFDKGNHTYARASEEWEGDARVIRDFRDARTIYPGQRGVCALYS